ncbi:mucin-2-like [Carassius auratus]|uniref:Mucin-2-like n=1 Tax=Carassius auratus TaxID=7957 RepID=A0A6P6KWS1_CARAU|nr:mucin-2-like [Carassius auratus]
MSWAKGVLFFTMAVVSLSSSLRTDPEVLSEVGVAYSANSKNTVNFGRLLIGGQGTVPYNNLKTSALRSPIPDGHQSNEEVWLPSVSTKLRHLGSSVQCSNDSMILHIRGQRMPHFLIDRGEESPVPLSEMPASCGFSLKRARRDVSLVAPYRGCHVRQQGGSYVLPLIIMGAPVQMSCPVGPLLPTVSCFSFGMIVTLGIRADYIKIKVDGSWQPLLLTCSQCSFAFETTAAGSLVVTAPFTGSCWETTDTAKQLPLLYGGREVTLSCPLTQPTVAPTMDPTTPARDPTDMQQMFDRFGKPWWYPVAPATLPPTVPPTTATMPHFQYPFQPPMYPPKYPMPIFDPFYSKGDPVAPPALQPPYPWYPKFPPYKNGFHSPVEVTTPATTVPTPAPYQPEHQYPGYPMYPPYYGQPVKPFVAPTVKYPYMLQYPKGPISGPRSPRALSSPALLSSVYRSRR